MALPDKIQKKCAKRVQKYCEALNVKPPRALKQKKKTLAGKVKKLLGDK